MTSKIAKVKRTATSVLLRLQKQNPEPKCELFFKTDYQLLVSVVLSAQSTDKMVNRCMEPLYRKNMTPETVIKMGIKGFESKIRSLGLAPTKAKNVFHLSRRVVEEFQGRVPDSREELESLPGVGRKTASVVLAEVFHHPTLAVDTHVFRVTRRLGLHNESTPMKAEGRLMEVVPSRFLPKAHHWFIQLGRYTCKAQKPLCHLCHVQDLCPSSLPL